MLVPLDSTAHDVDAFTSGVAACDEDLRRQARKQRSRCLVMAEDRRILGFGCYRVIDAGPDRATRPCILIDFVARDRLADAGTGTGLMLRLFIHLVQDPKTELAKGVLIDSHNCGDADACARRWRFFTNKIGFVPLRDDGQPFGYAFMPMSTVKAIAAAAQAARDDPQ